MKINIEQKEMCGNNEDEKNKETKQSLVFAWSNA
jgi:hypothetical protein